jgi:formylmethanofuran--tetrahydromethanopterin N-formyltransferase
LGQNILTCPTASAWNQVDSVEKFKIGKKLGYFGDGFQKKASHHNRNTWVIPIMGGEFIVEAHFGYAEGVMGGNLWFMGESLETALAATEKALAVIEKTEGVITPFPGGITWSGSKAGSRYPFLIASTYHTYCPTLRDKLEDSKVPSGVQSIMEIIINGKNPEIVQTAMQAGVKAALDSPGLIKISAGNYGGRLGKYRLWLQNQEET